MTVSSSNSQLFYLMIEGRPEGPFPASAVSAKARSGIIGFDTQISRNRNSNWRRASDIPALREMIESAKNSYDAPSNGDSKHDDYRPTRVSLDDTPIPSADQAKVIIFLLLLVPAVFLLVGIIPAIFIAAGWILMARNSNFSNMTAFMTCAKAYIGIIIALSIGAIWLNISWLDQEVREYYREDYRRSIASSFVVLTISSLYYFAFSKLFYTPLLRHQNWVSQHGVFTSNPKKRAQKEVDIIRGEKLHRYSVADELTKWANLRSAGHISESEYVEARRKLLNKNSM